jgi:hypothetical protein
MLGVRSETARRLGVTTGVARFAQEAKNLVCRFSLPAAALRHQISETPRALCSSDEVKLPQPRQDDRRRRLPRRPTGTR